MTGVQNLDSEIKNFDCTHLIKVEQNLPPIQLVSLQTDSLVHEQLLRRTVHKELHTHILTWLRNGMCIVVGATDVLKFSIQIVKV